MDDEVNCILRNQRDPTITERGGKSCATPIDMWSVDDPSKRVQFMGTYEAQRHIGIHQSNIVKIMDGKRNKSRIKKPYRDFVVNEWVKFERSPPPPQPTDPFLSMEVPCKKANSNSMNKVVFETADSQPVFYDCSGYEMSFNVMEGCFVKRVNEFVHASGKLISGVIAIHVILASMFHKESYSDGLTVDHINRNPQDNRLSNLRWATGGEQRENQRRGERKRMIPFDRDLPNEVWRPLCTASCFCNNADFSQYQISNHCRIRRDDMLLNINRTRSGYTRVAIQAHRFYNYRLACMVFETELWDFLISKGVPITKIDVDHRGGLHETYIDVNEAAAYCADPQKWYEEQILSIEAMRKRKRE